MAANLYVKITDDSSYVRLQNIERAYVVPTYSDIGKYEVRVDMISGASYRVSGPYDTRQQAQTWLDGAISNSV